MNELKIPSPEGKCVTSECLILRARLDELMTNDETVGVSKSTESAAVIPLERLFDDADSRFARRVLGILSDHDMPGAEMICIKPCEVTSPSPVGRFLGKKPKITEGTSVPAYNLFALGVNYEGIWRGTGFLSEDGNVWVHESTTSEHPDASDKKVTRLAKPTVYPGEVVKRDDDDVPRSSINYHADKLVFRRKPLKELLLGILATNHLNAE